MDAPNQSNIIHNINLGSFLHFSDLATREDKTWTEANIQAVIKYEQETIQNFTKGVFQLLNDEFTEDKNSELNSFINGSLLNITNAMELKDSMFQIRDQLVLLIKRLSRPALEALHKQYSEVKSAVINEAILLGAIHHQWERYVEKGTPDDVSEEEHLFCLAYRLAVHGDPSKATQVFERMLSSDENTRHAGNHIVQAFRYQERFIGAYEFIYNTRDKWVFDSSLELLAGDCMEKNGLKNSLEILKLFPAIKDFALKSMLQRLWMDRSLSPQVRLKAEYSINKEMSNPEERERTLLRIFSQSLKCKMLADNEILDNFLEISCEIDGYTTQKVEPSEREEALTQALEKVIKNDNLEAANKIACYLPAAIFEEKILGLPKGKIA